MVRKIFVLASVSALAGIITTAAAGCSDDNPPNPGDPGQDAAPDVKKPPKIVDDGGDGGDPPTESCRTETEINTSTIPYKKARVQPSQCTAAESTKLKEYVDGHASPDLAGWKATVSTTCAACVFAEDGESWSPIVVKNNKIGNVNIGGCLEAVSGKTECGAAYQRWAECPAEACKDCDTQAKFDACKKDTNAIYKGPCKAALLKVETECGDKVSEYEDTCFEGTKYYFEGSVNHLCVAGPKDAGSN